MRELIYTVNDWKLFEDDNYFVIENTTHPDWNNTYFKDRNRYKYGHKRVPKSIDRKIKSKINSRSDIEERTFGIEIECYHKTNRDIRSQVAHELRVIGIACVDVRYTHEVMETWKVTTDSSIRGGEGLEVVSPILKGQSGIEEIKKVMKVLTRLGCRVNRTTGLHVHIGANDLSTGELHNVFRFYRQNEQIFDSIVARSRRGDDNTYTRSLRNYSDFPTTRYTKVNYQSYLKYGTIEFRQHQGSLNGDKAEHWIKLVRQIIATAKIKDSRQFSDLEGMLSYLNLSDDISWYLERQEELAG